MTSNVVGLAAVLALIASLCVGAIFGGNRHARELSWVAMVATVGVVVLGVAIVTT